MKSKTNSNSNSIILTNSKSEKVKNPRADNKHEEGKNPSSSFFTPHYEGDWSKFVDECLENNPYDKYLEKFNLFKPEEIDIKEEFEDYVIDVNPGKILIKDKTMSELREYDKEKLPDSISDELRSVSDEDYLSVRRKLVAAWNKSYLEGVI